MRLTRRSVLAGATFATAALGQNSGGAPLRLAVAGLVHGHANGFLRAAEGRTDMDLVGVAEPKAEVRAYYAERFKIPADRQFASVTEMIAKAKPEAVASFGSTFDHPTVVEAAAAARLPVMMEKPLAVSQEHAERIRKAAAASGIPVIVNYETTWYRSHGQIWEMVKRQKAIGDIRKMVAMDGHSGPKGIGVGREFFEWLTDPVKNGAGALFDFGCYGANLMTWLMDDQRPLSVTARTLTARPDVYPKVDDEATILLDYPKAQGIIQASWNWPFSRKDFEVYGATGYTNAYGGNSLRVRLPGEKEEHTATLPELPADERDSVSYLAAIARGRLKPGGLSSLENNLVATEILVAARESARTGRTVKLPLGG